ncbi:MAG: SDR family NAD(P)-dependent oxidoreductase [Burkholderiaceae bacterium]|jgi:benzil reductase ((S)-benzoin forming)|nr:SDR family NAD(P)-dependent oxidoreductase [Burkholderiaceae bacterium]
MRLFILTGASRGLGRAMASQLLAGDVLLLTIQRKPDALLQDEARTAGAKLEQWALDVAHDVGVAARLETWLHQHSSCASATLINNAGAIGTVGPIDLAPADEIATVLRVGLEAPLVLAAAFLRATRDWRGERRVLNISSGAGRNPIAGWAPYCAAKAGLDHFSRVTALDEARRPNGARIVSLAPGVIDTAMQSHLRAADAAGFPDKQRFLDLHSKSQLATPEGAAAKVLAYLARADFGQNPVADVRDA